MKRYHFKRTKPNQITSVLGSTLSEKCQAVCGLHQGSKACLMACVTAGAPSARDSAFKMQHK